MGVAREGKRKFESRNLDKIKVFFRPSTLKGSLCVHRGIVDTIFNMEYGSRKSAMAERVKGPEILRESPILYMISIQGVSTEGVLSNPYRINSEYNLFSVCPRSSDPFYRQ